MHFRTSDRQCSAPDGRNIEHRNQYEFKSSEPCISQDITTINRQRENIVYVPNRVHLNWASDLIQRWRNPVWQSNVNRHCHKMYVRQQVSHLNLTINELKQCRVIGQCDRKFIVLLCKESIFMMDQHAVDERIRYEKLLASVNEHFAVTNLQITCSSEHARFISYAVHDLQNWGIHIIVKFTETGGILHLTRVPQLLILRGPLGQESLLDDFIHFAQTKSTNAPEIIHQTAASIACRDAIKFGDHLSKQQIINLVRSLCHCKMPFHCAHGRPSVAPVAVITTSSTFRKE